MSVEIEDLGENKKAGGGGGGKKAAKPAQVFVQATSTVNSMSATKTGKSLQFWHGQRGVRKKTPAVNEVFPGVYTDGEEPIMLWDGVNLFKHYAAKPDDIEQGLQKCEWARCSWRKLCRAVTFEDERLMWVASQVLRVRF